MEDHANIPIVALNAFRFCKNFLDDSLTRMSSPPKISVAIVGGGIGGLSLATGLQKCLHLDVHVYEGTRVYREIGGGLAIHGNGIRAMELIGEEVKKAYFDSAELSAKDEDQEMTTDVLVAAGKHSHEMLASLGAAKASEEQHRKSAANFLQGRKTVARADLLNGLAKLVQKERLHLGKRLASIGENRDGKITLHFEDGSEAFADCLIGADGIHSKTRSYLLGENHPATSPKDQGWILFRRLVPMEEARQCLDDTLLTKVPIYCGPGSGINCMPVHGGRTYQITLTAVKAAVWSEDDDNESLVVRSEFYKDWIPEVQTIVEVGVPRLSWN
jgi:salicylate hydroxylase